MREKGINKEAFPYLANFLETWFHTSYDFDELNDVIDRMKSLRAWENLYYLRREILALDKTPLDDFNKFSRRHGGREFSKDRFKKFKQILYEIDLGEY